MSPVPGLGPDCRESGPNRSRWTTKEVRWVVNERAMNVIAKTTIARKTVQLVRWSSRKAWVLQASQSARAPDSALAESGIGVVPPVEISRHPSLDPSRVSRRTHLTSLITTIGNRKKRLCARLRSGDKHHLRKSADQKAQISLARGTHAFLICAFRSAGFLRWCLSPECNLTHNLFFLFPIVFGINFLSNSNSWPNFSQSHKCGIRNAHGRADKRKFTNGQWPNDQIANELRHVW